MQRTILLLTVICFYATAFSQKEKGEAYIAKYKDIAMAEMQRSGVPAAITLAQGILESKFGESDLCVQSNNHFGIKCKTEWTGEKVYHDDDAKHECFRSYPDAAASFRDHSDFLKNRPYYTDLFKLDITDVEGWAYGLKKDGYATEKEYPQRLLKVINDYNLNQYTLLALQKQNSSPVAAQQESVSMNAAVPAKNKTTITAVSEKEEVEIITIILSRLLAFNEIEEMDILPTDTLLFLEMKMKKGAVDFHIAEPGETLHRICQKEGVRMDAVMQYNNIKPNMMVLAGEKVYLRGPAPVIPKTVASENAK